MEYTIQKLAKMAGVSTRTLRWYDECGLLKPRRISTNGYRVYGRVELDRLQQILFYRSLEVSLPEIGRILSAEDFNGLAALQSHYTALRARHEQLSLLIENVEKSILAMKGEITMSDTEKFEGFKRKLINENEQRYGAEIRQRYGESTIDRSNRRVRGMTHEQYAQAEQLSREVNETLKEAFLQGDPASEVAQKACDLHRRWLSLFWDRYSREAHLGVTQMYVDDPRFTAYYDQIAPGCAIFLRDAVRLYCGEA